MLFSRSSFKKEENESLKNIFSASDIFTDFGAHLVKKKITLCFFFAPNVFLFFSFSFCLRFESCPGKLKTVDFDESPKKQVWLFSIPCPGCMAKLSKALEELLLYLQAPKFNLVSSSFMWLHSPSVVNKSTNLGTTNAQEIWPGSEYSELYHHQPHSLPNLPEKNCGRVVMWSRLLQCKKRFLTISWAPTLLY